MNRLSVLQMAEQAVRCGRTFRIDEHGVAIDSWANVPDEIRAGLLGRWADLKALLIEWEPEVRVPHLSVPLA